MDFLMKLFGKNLFSFGFEKKFMISDVSILKENCLDLEIYF